MNTLSTRLVTLSIVSHGHGPLLAELLGDLARHQDSDHWKIVITLNLASEAFRAEDWPNLNIISVRNEAPRGFGANHNSAFDFCDTPWFVVLNPDLRLPENPFPTLIERAAGTHKLGAIAPRIVDSTGRIEDSVRENLTPWSIVHRKINPEAGRAEANSIDGGYFWLAGMFMMFPATAFLQVRGFDERYFLYCEDYDLCTRLRRAGFTLAVEDRVACVHNAQRDSHRSRRHLQWHLSSLIKVWTSSAYWWATFRRRSSPMDR